MNTSFPLPSSVISNVFAKSVVDKASANAFAVSAAVAAPSVTVAVNSFPL